MSDICPIQGLDHLEFYVGNAKQAAMFYAQCFGFANTAYRGLETGDRTVTSYVMEQGDIRFILSSALAPDHPIARSVLAHGDTIAVMALAVADVAGAYQRAIAHGAISHTPPTVETDDQGSLEYAVIHAYGDTLIKLVGRDRYCSPFAPGFVQRSSRHTSSIGLTHIDHVVGNVEKGTMNDWVKFFIKTMGFSIQGHFDDRDISTEYSALMSKVLQNGSKTMININEPATGRRQSQIQEYLDYHGGPGIQHIGLATHNILKTVTRLKRRGIDFLPIPQRYYDELPAWVQDIDLPIAQLAQLGILVDRDPNGYLLQLFTKPVGDRPTLFFEIIERHGSKGFGAGNFKSLFVALEQEQALRGNL